MNKTNKFLIFFVAVLFTLASCKSMVLNGVSTALSGANQKGITSKPNTSENNPMLAITGETDITLISDFFPTILELYEIMYKTNPSHLGLAAMAGSLNVMYANVFIQWPASDLPLDQFDKQNDEYMRAKMHYLRGRNYCLRALEGRHPGFTKAVLGTDTDEMQKAVDTLDENDVNAAYWACAGWLGAFSVDLLDPDLLGCLSSPPAILEKAASLDPNYSDGAIWDLLCQFNISAVGFGGDADRAMECYKKALEVSGGKSPGIYVTYAESFCVPNDKAGFVDALNKALAINPDDNPSSRLMTTISQKKARNLLKKIDELFLSW